MRVVLYAHDMEPITVLELSSWAYDFLKKHREVNLPCYSPIRTVPPSEADAFDQKFWQVHITAETLHRHGEQHMMLFTHNEEEALLLKAAFLPGQRSMLKEHERKAFANGFLLALSRLTG